MASDKPRHHKNDRCLVCRERKIDHGRGKDKNGKLCNTFEFVAPSARSDNDVLWTALFPSSTSNKTWIVSAWRQGDYSCTCIGWRNQRTCHHCDKVAADPKHYAKVAGTVSATAGSVEGTVRNLNAKMVEMEAAVLRGDRIEIAKLQAEIDYQRQMFEVAGDGLGERFNQVVAKIDAHVFGNMSEPRTAQSSDHDTDLKNYNRHSDPQYVKPWGNPTHVCVAGTIVDMALSDCILCKPKSGPVIVGADEDPFA